MSIEMQWEVHEATQYFCALNKGFKSKTCKANFNSKYLFNE
jgi:hypothetical protein